MQKQIGSILFVAGTTIGSGIMALPMTIAKLGLIPSILLMLVIWAVMYYTALISIELNLQAGKGLPIGALGKHYSGNIASFIGTGSFTVLSYALLAVYIYGGSSIIHAYVSQNTIWHPSFNVIASLCAIVAALLIIGPILYIDMVNRFFFSAKCAVLFILVVSLGRTMQYDHLPLITNNINHPTTWQMVAPVIFTSFGYQVIYHSMTEYCQHNALMLKRAFFWGSLIPAIIYIAWTVSILTILHQSRPDFYHQVVYGKTDIGEIINILSQIHEGQPIQRLFWWISCLSVVTSIIGVGLGLSDAWKKRLQSISHNAISRHLMAVIITIAPAYLVAIMVPNAFIAVLGFAGMILVIIAVLLPLYLLRQARIHQLIYAELRHRWLKLLCVISGLIIMGCELLNIFQPIT